MILLEVPGDPAHHQIHPHPRKQSVQSGVVIFVATNPMQASWFPMAKV